jgi:hypothetical protein
LGVIVEEKHDGRGKRNGEVKSTRQPPIIYFNIGWMERYAGFSKDDETKGGHGFLKEHQHGGEAFNFFVSEAGTMRGHRPPGASERTNITKMGAANRAGQIDGALVVWLAKEPASKRALIVGWYRNATVFRVARDGGIDMGGERIHYSAEAAEGDVVLLPPLMRTFQVESSRTNPGAGFGQKPTWYGSEAVNRLVWAYIRTHGSERSIRPRSSQPNPPKNLDPELRRKVEKAAVAHATAYYRKLYGPTCLVESVEPYAKGWDLEIFVGHQPLLVEVKGLMNSRLICELTPNEYEKMMFLEHRPRYIVYVVNNALAELPAVPLASIFEHAGGKRWVTDDGRELVITPTTAAVLSCL